MSDLVAAQIRRRFVALCERIPEVSERVHDSRTKPIQKTPAIVVSTGTDVFLEDEAMGSMVERRAVQIVVSCVVEESDRFVVGLGLESQLQDAMDLLRERVDVLVFGDSELEGLTQLVTLDEVSATTDQEETAEPVAVQTMRFGCVYLSEAGAPTRVV